MLYAVIVSLKHRWTNGRSLTAESYPNFHWKISCTLAFEAELICWKNKEPGLLKSVFQGKSLKCKERCKFFCSKDFYFIENETVLNECGCPRTICPIPWPIVLYNTTICKSYNICLEFFTHSKNQLRYWLLTSHFFWAIHYC